MEVIHCVDCGSPIHPGRLEALPGTETCMRCSRERPRTVADVDVAESDALDMCRSAAAPDRENR